MDTNPTPKLDLSWITGDLLLYVGGAIALVALLVLLVAWACVRANEAIRLEREAEEAERDEVESWAGVGQRAERRATADGGPAR